MNHKQPPCKKDKLVKTCSPKNILEYLEHTAMLYPDAPAYCTEDEQFSWQEVQTKTCQIGAFVLKHRRYDTPFHLAVILMERAPHTILALLGMVYAGYSYMILDPGIMRIGSGQKLNELLAFLQPELIVCEAEREEQIQALFFQKEKQTKLLSLPSRSDTWFLPDITQKERAVLQDIQSKMQPDDTLCLTFTSSSSGQPKCVETSHKAVIQYIEGLAQILDADQTTIFGGQAPFSYDACMKEIFVSLKCGGSAWFIPPELFSFPEKLILYLNRHQINTICWVSSAYALPALTDCFESCKPEYLRTAAFGSEVLAPDLLAYWKHALPKVSFFNLYGPTEATGMSCYYRVPDTFTPENTPIIPIGDPFPGVKILLLDENKKEVSKDEIGEIYIQSSRLAKGYYHAENLTQSVFLTGTEIGSSSGYPIYRTGDLAKRLPDGSLVFLGRLDSQVKRMGHRIHLAEIERLASGCPQVAECCCVQQPDGRIVLYISENSLASDTPSPLLKEQKEPNEATLLSERIMSYLRQELPDYALPNQIILLEKLPHLEVGKLNRKALQLYHKGEFYESIAQNFTKPT